MINSVLASWHPAIVFAYFMLSTLLTMLIRHPVWVAFSLLLALLYCCRLRGKAVLRQHWYKYLPLVLLTAAINPLFNHRGMTVLAHLPNGNAITLEALSYGLVAAAMLLAVLLWFSSYNLLMSSDKLSYLLGRITPRLALLFIMCMRLLPLFGERFGQVLDAQKMLEGLEDKGSLIQRIRLALRSVAVVVGWSLEKAVDMADAMRSRAYGSTRRSCYAAYEWSSRDTLLLLIMAAVLLIICVACAQGGLSWQWYPHMRFLGSPWSMWLGLTGCALWYSFPVLADLVEDKRWKFLRSKM